MAQVSKTGITTQKTTSPFNGAVIDLAKKYAEMEIAIRKAEVVLKEMQAQQALVEKQLVELAEMSDINPPFRLENLGTVTLVNDLSVTTENKELLLHSLASLGKEDLITQQVNMQTLKSFIKERLRAGVKGARQLPRGINITPYQQARFTKARES